MQHDKVAVYETLVAVYEPLMMMKQQDRLLSTSVHSRKLCTFAVPISGL